MSIRYNTSQTFRPNAERAFRRYAAYRLDRRRLTPFEIYAAIRGLCAGEEEALDMLAVYDTLRLLELNGHPECAGAVRSVYFWSAGRRPRRNDITYRVRRRAYETSFDERTVYRQLCRAKDFYCRLRSMSAYPGGMSAR